MNLELEYQGYLLRFISTTGESRAQWEQNTFQDAWQSSLTVEILEAKALSVTGLLAALSALLKSGFNGWISADSQNAPKAITSYKIYSEGADTGGGTGLFVTIGFKAMMPKGMQ